MDGDFTRQEVQAPALDIQRLPEIEYVRAVRVYYDKPVLYAEGALRKEANEAIEFQLTTSADFPIRALTPALFVGDIAVTEGRRVGERQYRFVSYGQPQFEENAPIALGWVGSGVPMRKPSRFIFHLEGEEKR
jgi:hypothetical protein